MPMTVHGTPGNIGSRHWLHAQNHADAIRFVLEETAMEADIVNITGDVELNNLEMVERIADILAVPANVTYVDFHRTRPGHDRRYALDGTKLRDAGWRPPLSFDPSLEATVRWTAAHQEWLRPPAAGTTQAQYTQQ